MSLPSWALIMESRSRSNVYASKAELVKLSDFVLADPHTSLAVDTTPHLVAATPDDQRQLFERHRPGARGAVAGDTCVSSTPCSRSCSSRQFAGLVCSVLQRHAA
jgi:hypothetical protein